MSNLARTVSAAVATLVLSLLALEIYAHRTALPWPVLAEVAWLFLLPLGVGGLALALQKWVAWAAVRRKWERPGAAFENWLYRNRASLLKVWLGLALLTGGAIAVTVYAFYAIAPELLKSPGPWTFILAVGAAPILFFLRLVRDRNKAADIRLEEFRQVQAVFEKVQEWASGKDKDDILQAAAIHGTDPNSGRRGCLLRRTPRRGRLRPIRAWPGFAGSRVRQSPHSRTRICARSWWGRRWDGRGTLRGTLHARRHRLLRPDARDGGSPQPVLEARTMPRALRAIAGLCALLAAVTLAACGGGGGGGGGALSNKSGPSIYPRFAYVVNNIANDVSVYAVDPASGRLRWIDSAATQLLPVGIALHPSGQYAYITNSTSGTVSQYTIGDDGSLTPMTPDASVPAGANPFAIALHPSGDFAYVANHGGTTVSQYDIDPVSGALTAMTPSATVTAGTSPRWIALHPSGKYAYVANEDGTVSQYSIDPLSGALAAMTPDATVAAGTTPYSVTVHPSGKFAYVPNFGDGTVSQYTVGADGALTEIGAPAAAGTNPYAVAVHPSGKYAYVSNNGDANISQYTIGADGTLTAMADPTVPAGTQVTGITVDPSGHHAFAVIYNDDLVAQYSIDADGSLNPDTMTFAVAHRTPTFMAMSQGSAPVKAVPLYAYAANWGDDELSQYSIGTNGALTTLSPGTVATGTGPNRIAVHPTNRYVYVTNYSGNSVSQYSVGLDGTLTALSPAAVDTGNTPIAIAVEPAGRFAYVTCTGTNSVYQFSVATDGTLAALAPTNIAAETTPDSIAVDPSGRYVYVGNVGSNKVSQYTIGLDGTLAAMASPTANTGTAPSGIAVHPSGRYAYVTNRDIDNVQQYTIGSDGALAVMTPATVGAGDGPQGIAIDPSGRHLYVANYNGYDVSQYLIGADGALSEIGTPRATGNAPFGLAIDPSGRSVYVPNRSDATVSQFRIGSSGTLTPLSPATAAAGALPTATATVGTWK